MVDAVDFLVFGVGGPCGLVRRWGGWGSAVVWWLDLLVRCVGVGFVGLTGFASVWFAGLFVWLGYRGGFLALLLLVYCDWLVLAV